MADKDKPDKPKKPKKPKGLPLRTDVMVSSCRVSNPMSGKTMQ